MPVQVNPQSVLYVRSLVQSRLWRPEQVDEA